MTTMKTNSTISKMLCNALYVVLPVGFFAVIHLFFSYVMWDANPINWRIDTRFFSAFIGFIAFWVGILAASDIYSKKNKE